MPEIGKENFDYTFGQIWSSPSQQVNFVRAGDRIIYYVVQRPEEVERLISEFELSTPEDGGFLRVIWNMRRQTRTIVLMGNSSYLGLPKIEDERTKTSQILNRHAQNSGINIFRRMLETL